MRNPFKKLAVLGLLALAFSQAGHATLSSTTNQTITANGNGVTVNYTIGFTFRDNDDILVYLEDTSVTPHTRTLKSYGGGAGQYTITGGDPGTTVHMGTAPTSSERLVIKRATPRSQTVDYDETQAFPASDHEAQLDKMTMSLQEMDSEIARKIGLAAGTTSSTPTFPEPVASTYLRYDGSALLDTRTYAQVLSDIQALKTSNNLSDLTNAATARLNLGIDSLNSLPILGSNGEVLTIAGGALDYAQITNSNVDNAAAIAYSKLNLTGSVTNSDLATVASANTAGAVVARDGSGNFSAGTITANLTGNVTGNVTGNASTASALAANPTACSAGQFVSDIAADGTLTCSTPAGAGDVTGPSSSVDNELVLFSGTGGKTIKRAAGSGAVSVSSGVVTQGTLSVGNGGTGATTHTAHNMLIGNGSSAITSLSPSSAGKRAVSDGTDWTAAYTSYGAKSSNYTATGADDTILFTADATLTLAAASGLTGKVYHIVTSGTGTDVTVDPNSTETVCGQTTVTVDGDGDALDIVSDGTNWRGLGGTCNRRISVYGNSGSTSILSQFGNCISSIGNPGTGRSTVNITSGCYSSAPYCMATVTETGGSGQGCDWSAAVTTTGGELRTRQNTTGTLTADDWYVTCVGPR